MLSVDYEIPVLVEEPTVFQGNRIDHAQRWMLFNRKPAVQTSAHHLAHLQIPPPPSSFFEDRFVSVYPVLDAVFPIFEKLPYAPPFALFYPKSNRVDDPLQEDSFHRVDHTLLFRYVLPFTSQVVAYQLEFVDLCDNPWLEWVPQPIGHALRLYPFRSVTKTGTPQPFNLTYYQSPNWRLEAELDMPQARIPDQTYPFRQIYVTQQSVIERVRATAVGDYGGILRNIGDVFDINVGAFSSSTVNYIPGVIGQPLFGWMVVVAATTPLQSNPPTPLQNPAFNGTVTNQTSGTYPRLVY